MAQISTHLYAPLTRKHCPTSNADKSFVSKTTDSPTHLELPSKGWYQIKGNATVFLPISLVFLPQ